MNLESFTGPGSTPSRRRFWDKVTAAVNASQKLQGENVSVEEHDGMGTLINVPSPNRRPTSTLGACCVDGECSQTTEGDCAGTFQGVGVPCDPNPCVTCSNCDPINDALFGPFCVDGDDNCWTGPEDVEGCNGEIVPCGSFFLTDLEYCLNLDGSVGRLCCNTTHDPTTCETVQTDCDGCACDGPGEAGAATHQAADVWMPCTTCTGLECGACCHDDGCWTTSLLECFNFGFTFYAGMSCDGLYCPV